MNEVHKWLVDDMCLPAATEGSWVWVGRSSIGMHSHDVAALRNAGFKHSTKRRQYFHVSTKFLPGERAEGLHAEPIPFPPGYVKRKPGPKKGSKRGEAYVLRAVSTTRDEYEPRIELGVLLAAVPD